MAKRLRDKNYKYAQIKTDLSIQILEGQLRPHERIPSLNELTAKYKVSKITARRALNDLVAEGLAYASRGRGSFVADIRSRRASATGTGGAAQLGVVFEHAAGNFMSDIIHGIDEEAYNRGIQINLCLSHNSCKREAENLQRLAGQGVDRIILFMVIAREESAHNPNIPVYLKLQEQGVRLLLLGCEIPGFPIPSIVYDDANAFRQLVEYMKAQGARRLAYVTRRDNASTTFERLRGFKDGLLESGLPYEQQNIVKVTADSVDHLTSATEDQVRRYLRVAQVRPDGILCSDEIVAAGVFNALEDLNSEAAPWPLVGGMGSGRNRHVLRGNPYVLLEDDTRLLGREAAAMVLSDDFGADSGPSLLRRVIPAPLRPPRRLTPR